MVRLTRSQFHHSAPLRKAVRKSIPWFLMAGASVLILVIVWGHLIK
jgi:hypothetical protein